MEASNIMDNIRSNSLQDIADWQLNRNNESVDLPELQRGFVWKPYQIEGVWDSLLRGFPIGSFLLSTDDNKKLFILDGQQRATSIALGFYNPWQDEENQKFWSLKKIPVLWLDLLPNEKTLTQKYVLKLITQSHPWGYQTVVNTKILSLADRRDALEIFKCNPNNNSDHEDEKKGYTQFSFLHVFPYDSTLPVPLSFLISSIKCNDWKNNLLKLCKEANFPSNYIRTKHLIGNYIEKLSAFIEDDNINDTIFQAIKNLEKINIPSIITNKEVLESEEEQTGEDPTLFVRLNSAGTPIAGEELLYSIYKATYPNSKELVESIGIDFIPPSRVISLTSRLALSEISEKYPYPIGLNDFRKHLKEEKFSQKLENLIGNKESSPIANFFNTALEIFQSEGALNIPPVLVKNLIKDNPELMLMTLQWIKLRKSNELTNVEKKKMLAVFTALSWFGIDNARYVKELWNKLGPGNVWNSQTLKLHFYCNEKYIMHPLIQPDDLREFLLKSVVQERTLWEELYTKPGDKLNEEYLNIIDNSIESEEEKQGMVNEIWANFIESLFGNKSILLFAQREYINEEFKDFNQLETLEDTNAPWDWDHIYPKNWFHNRKPKVDPIILKWSTSIGNFRAISLEHNRRDGNCKPSEKLIDSEEFRDVKLKSFVKEKDKNFENDWDYWQNIHGRIDDNNNKEIMNYLSAVIHRLCNIYKEWYDTLKIGDLFG
jgi:hypothetical protein